MLRELGDVTNADEAIDAGKAEQWARFRALGKDYADLRDQHVELLLAADTANFAVRSAARGFAFFTDLDSAVPLYVRIMTRGTESDFKGIPLAEGLPFEINDHRDPAHFLAVVKSLSHVDER